MSKGIRPAVNAKFMELSPKRLAGEFGPIDTPLAAGNTKFRRTIMDYAMEQFSITNAAAATAYNTARIKCAETNPELVVGLGRPEDKKGGRKKKLPGVEKAAEVIQQRFTVRRVRDKEVVGVFYSIQDAEARVAKNVTAKKVKLEVVSEQ